MYDSSMKTDTYPLAVPPELLGADIMRQSMKLGLPRLREHLSTHPLKDLEPMSRAESRRCYQQPNPEFDALEHHLASLPSPPPAAE